MGKETLVMFYSIGGHSLTSFYKDYINWKHFIYLSKFLLLYAVFNNASHLKKKSSMRSLISSKIALKKGKSTDWVTQLVGGSPRRVLGLIPSWGRYERQPNDISLSCWCFSLFLPSSLSKNNKNVTGWEF